MRRAIQVLGVVLMAAALLVDASVRNRAGRNLTSRLPLALFWVGAVLVVLSSI